MFKRWNLIHTLVLAALIILPASLVDAQEKVALIIGNSSYENATSLPNPTNDADDIATTLSEVGFEITKIKDVTYSEMRLALRQFSRRAASAKIALIYYAGHGMEVNKHNYLIPTDAVLASDRDVDFEAVPLDLLTQAATGASELSLILLDACRNNPFAAKMKRTSGTRSIGRGLAAVEPTAGTLVSFAAKEGTVASDGRGRNSPYTRALVKYLRQPGLEIQFMFRKIRDAVLRDTNRNQEPFVYDSLPGKKIYLVAPEKGKELVPKTPPAPPPANDQLSTSRDSAQSVYNDIKNSNDIEILELFASQFPGSIYTKFVRAKIKKLQLASLPPADPEPTDRPFENDTRILSVTEITRGVQAELNRLGCEAGVADGKWGGGSKRALSRLKKHSSIEVSILEPSEFLLRALRKQKSNVCPLVCKIGFGIRDNLCVRMSVEDQISGPKCKEFYKKFQTKGKIGAFAVSLNGKYCGASWGYETRKEASTNAEKHCLNNEKAKSCRVIDITPAANRATSKSCKGEYEKWRKKGGFGAFAVSGSGAACGWSATFKTSKEARTSALKGCRKHRSGCHIIQTRSK